MAPWPVSDTVWAHCTVPVAEVHAQRTSLLRLAGPWVVVAGQVSTWKLTVVRWSVHTSQVAPQAGAGAVADVTAPPSQSVSRVASAVSFTV